MQRYNFFSEYASRKQKKPTENYGKGPRDCTDRARMGGTWRWYYIIRAERREKPLVPEDIVICQMALAQTGTDREEGPMGRPKGRTEREAPKEGPKGEPEEGPTGT